MKDRMYVLFMDANSEAGRVDWEEILKRVLKYVDFFVPSYEELRFMLLCVCVGSVSISVGDTAAAIWNTIWGLPVPAGVSQSIIVLVRLPRVLCVALAGAALSLCGGAMLVEDKGGAERCADRIDQRCAAVMALDEMLLFKILQIAPYCERGCAELAGEERYFNLSVLFKHIQYLFPAVFNKGSTLFHMIYLPICFDMLVYMNKLINEYVKSFV